MVNLSQITRIDNNAFRECTSLAELATDNVTAIDENAFWGCTSLQTLKIPQCTRFGIYIVTGCSSLTRIEATAAGDFVDIDDVGRTINETVFQNKFQSGEEAFNSAECALVLNADKQAGGSAVPTISDGNRWSSEYIIWKSIGFQ